MWHNLLTDTLVEHSFQLNSCDLCVANAVVKRKQCAITWRVDDTKTSHEDSNAVDDVTQMLENKFGKTNVVRGSCHEFLGQIITCNYDGTFDLNMSSYLKEAVDLHYTMLSPL